MNSIFQNIRNGLSGDIVEPSKLEIAISTSFVKLSNFLSLFKGKLRLALSPSAFLDHIHGIFLGCAKKQMIGVNTEPNVALVTNKKSFWNLASKKLPRKPMRRMAYYVFSAFFIGVELPVARSGFGAVPKPAGTFVCFINFLNESFVNVFAFHSHMGMMPYANVGSNAFTIFIGD